jgi:hypothetical protein
VAHLGREGRAMAIAIEPARACPAQTLRAIGFVPEDQVVQTRSWKDACLQED